MIQTKLEFLGVLGLLVFVFVFVIVIVVFVVPKKIKKENEMIAFLALLLVACVSNMQAGPMLVNVPIANVWCGPKEVAGPYEYPLLCSGRAVGIYTQAMYGEPVDQQQDGGDMAKVLMPGHWRFDQAAGLVSMIPGFVRSTDLIKNDDLFVLQPLVVTSDVAIVRARPSARTRASILLKLPFGSIVRSVELPDDDVWQTVMLNDGTFGYVEQASVAKYDEQVASPLVLGCDIAYDAKRFIAMPYNFGGRSLHQKNNMMLSSVDCSGLVHLLYQASGLLIPKISHAQYLFSTAVNPADLRPGDCIFFKRKASGFIKVSHVAMYLGCGKVIEAAGREGRESCVRIISVEDYFGAPLHKLFQGCEVLRQDPAVHTKLYFRTFLPTQEAALGLRKKFLALMRGDFDILLDEQGA